MVYKKIKEGFVAHSTTVYLLNQHNEIRGIYEMATNQKPLNTKKILKDMYNLVHEE